ncbi:hypothetical protein C8R45DRAFT_543215 [Mycena sanguinolenta]|nr:hypothetical protein C8R45DRAFT_543215 [Mycena sanguinolenta]
MIVQNDAADDHLGAFGFPPKEPVVFVVLHSEMPEQIFEIFADAEVRELFATGEEWGLQSISSGFSATVDIKVDNPAPKDGAHLFCVYNVPPSLSSEEHDKRCVEFVESFVEVPACRSHLVRFEHWESNNLLDDHIQTFGYSAAGPTLVSHMKLDGWDNAFEILRDAEAQQSALDAGNNGEHFDLKTNAYGFSGHVVTKFDKTV